jgi:hypothetical protein
MCFTFVKTKGKWNITIYMILHIGGIAKNIPLQHGGYNAAATLRRAELLCDYLRNW